MADLMSMSAAKAGVVKRSASAVAAAAAPPAVRKELMDIPRVCWPRTASLPDETFAAAQSLAGKIRKKGRQSRQIAALRCFTDVSRSFFAKNHLRPVMAERRQERARNLRAIS